MASGYSGFSAHTGTTGMTGTSGMTGTTGMTGFCTGSLSHECLIAVEEFDETVQVRAMGMLQLQGSNSHVATCVAHQD